MAVACWDGFTEWWEETCCCFGAGTDLCLLVCFRPTHWRRVVVALFPRTPLGGVEEGLVAKTRYKSLLEFAAERTEHMQLVASELQRRIFRYELRGSVGYVEVALGALDVMIERLGGTPAAAFEFSFLRGAGTDAETVALAAAQTAASARRRRSAAPRSPAEIAEIAWDELENQAQPTAPAPEIPGDALSTGVGGSAGRLAVFDSYVTRTVLELLDGADLRVAAATAHTVALHAARLNHLIDQ
jgi:hypothetical protein